MRFELIKKEILEEIYNSKIILSDLDKKIDSESRNLLPVLRNFKIEMMKLGYNLDGINITDTYIPSGSMLYGVFINKNKEGVIK